MTTNEYILELKNYLKNNLNINILHKQINYDKNNIVIICLKELGDVICLTSFLKILRYQEKNTNIIFICYKYTYPIIELCPYINKVIYIDEYIKDINYNTNNNELIHLLPLIENILADGFIKLAINTVWSDFNQLTNIINFLSGAKKRIAFAENDYQQYLKDKNFTNYKEENTNYLTDILHTPFNIIHTIDRYMYILEYIYNKKFNENLELWINKNDHININKNKINICIGLGASSNSKKYPIQKWINVLTSIYKQNNNIHFYLLGGKNDELSEQVINKLSFCTNYINKLTIRQNISIISQCNLYIGK